MGRPIGNRHRVPKKQWNKWNPIAQDMFNQMYMSVRHNQSILHHPHAPMLTSVQWQTVAWNVAWLAADAANGRDIRETIEERV